MDGYRELWPGGLRYRGESVGTDSLALAAFARGEGARRAADLGCASGILLLLLLEAWPHLEAEGIDLRPGAAAEARDNLAANGFSGRGRVHTGDLRGSALAPGGFELAVANPPYFAPGAGGVSPDGDRALRRTESVSPEELCAAAARLLRPGGALCLVHRAERLADILAALRGAGLEPKRLRAVAYAPKAAPSLFLCEGRKGARPGLVWEPALLQTDGQGRETPEYRKICHWEER